MSLMTHSMESIFDGDSWEKFRTLVEMTRPNLPVTEQIEVLYAEMEIRNALLSVADAIDSKDLPRILDHFDEGAIIAIGNTRFEGPLEIEQYFSPASLLHRITFHRLLNIVVRIGVANDKMPIGMVVSYFHASVIASDDDGRSLYGRYLNSFVKVGRQWKIREWRIIPDHARSYRTE